jgi:hypothetical protein
MPAYVRISVALLALCMISAPALAAEAHVHAQTTPTVAVDWHADTEAEYQSAAAPLHTDFRLRYLETEKVHDPVVAYGAPQHG